MTAGDPTLFPVLDPVRCVRSGDCVAACPTRCLDMTPAGPWLARPGDCVACGVCAAVCPADAIRMDERR
jgi:NAD-dependent dihydropyrimidine dehydrogenase PreA subunit